MCVMRCNKCNQLNFPDNDGEAAKKRSFCGDSSLRCDHASMTFDKSRQVIMDMIFIMAHKIKS